MQHILGRNKNTGNQGNSSQKPQFSFPRKEKDPNAMDINKLTVEERDKLMKEGKCFRCRKQGHLS
jgi:hypothetical protein